MKLFGNKRSSTRVQKQESSGSAQSRRLSGLQIVLTIVAAVAVMLVGAAVAAYQLLVRPVDLGPSQPTAQEAPIPEEEVFLPPTVTETEPQVDRETGEEITIEVETPASHKADFYNILLLGTDEDGSRTDTIMIGRLDVSDHTVALLSIPRDTLITGNYTVPKINSVYGGAGKGVPGIEALQRKLAQTLGFETDGYIMVNLQAFVELVDLVGGVEFDVPMQMDYEDPSQDLYIHLKPGVQLLDGQHAMQLVRFRKGYATQDIRRTQVQQQFLQALAEKCLSIGNLSKLSEVLKIFEENVTTDLTLGNLAYFAQELLKCDFETMFAYTLEGEAVLVGEYSCYAIYQNKTLQVVNEHFNPYEADITAANVSIRTPEQVHAEQAAQQAEEEAQRQEEAEDAPSEGPGFIPPEAWGDDLYGESVSPDEFWEPQWEGDLPTDGWTEETPDF